MNKVFKVIVGIFAAVGVIWTAMYAYESMMNKIFDFPWRWEEYARISSPNNECDAVIMRGNRGAMSSFAYALFVVETGKTPNPDDEYPEFSGDIDAKEIDWKSNKELVLNLSPKRILFVSPKAIVGGEEIRISVHMENYIQPVAGGDATR